MLQPSCWQVNLAPTFNNRGRDRRVTTSISGNYIGSVKEILTLWCTLNQWLSTVSVLLRCPWTSLQSIPFWNCLPGTELLQSLFRTQFSMGSLSQRYRRSPRRHRLFLWSYCRSAELSLISAELSMISAVLSLIPGALSWSLRWSAAPGLPIVAWLTKHCKTLLNIIKHYETLVKHCEKHV